MPHLLPNAPRQIALNSLGWPITRKNRSELEDIENLNKDSRKAVTDIPRGTEGWKHKVWYAEMQINCVHGILKMLELVSTSN